MAETAARDPQLSFIFKRPFDEQVAFFRGKLGNLVPTTTWRDLQGAAHDRAFMVAGASKADLLADLAGAVDKAVTEGETLQQFRARFIEIVQRNGWHGWTGEDTPAGRAWRTRLIYEQNLSTSYAAGRLAQLNAGDYPYWMYKHADHVQHPRPQHVAWDGLVLPADHPFWKSHYPPNGWLCHCRALGVRSPVQARRLGGDPEKALPDGWNVVDARTGELPGIDKGWGSQPGETASDTVRIAATKTIQWEYRLAKAFMADVPVTQRDALAMAIRTQPETGEAVRRYAQRILNQTEAEVPPYQTMGLLTSEEATQIAELTQVGAVAQESYDWTVDAFTVKKVLSDHGTEETEASRGQSPIVAADYALLPRLIATADVIKDAGMSDIGRPIIRMTATINGRRYGAVFEVRTGRRMLALQTFYKGR